jgi:glycosyltransferase involved in cell wall biosynthesis
MAAPAGLKRIRMRSVLHLIETGGPGGAESVFLELASRLRIDPLHPIPVVSRDGWLAGQLRRRGLEPVILAGQGSLNIRYLRSLTRLIRDNGTELVIAHLFGAAIYASLAGLLTRTPVISVLHGQSDISAGERFAAAKRWLLARGTDKTVFVSAALQNDLHPLLKIPRQQCAVIENGIDMSRYQGAAPAGLRGTLGLPAATVLIGAIGNLRRAKGYETLLRAAQPVCAARSDTHFVIAGDTDGGLFPELQRLQGQLGLTGRVHFLGLRSDVPAILADLDLFVLSSHTEGFSLALVEAMASGRPVIATRSGGPERIIATPQAGVLVPPRDPAALAAEISRLLENEVLRNELAAAARAAVIERFSSERMVSDYHQLSTSLLRRSAGQPPG